MTMQPVIAMEKPTGMPSVSVIIPCYRDAATLGRALDSLYAQTHPVDEIIVVNDCSPETEEIEAVLLAYPRVVYARNEINLGLAATRNRGLELATGEVASFLDADDEYHPEKVALQLKALAPGRVVTCRVMHVWPGDSPDLQSFAQQAAIPSRTVTSRLFLPYSNSLNGAGLMAPRKVLAELGGYDGTLRSCEDFDLWLRLLNAGMSVIELKEPLYLYYFNPQGLSKNPMNISRWELEVVKKHIIRNSPDGRQTFGQGLLVAFWLLKHLVRSELVGEEQLRQVTQGNYSLVQKPLLKTLLFLFDALRMQKLLALVLKTRRWFQ